MILQTRYLDLKKFFIALLIIISIFSVFGNASNSTIGQNISNLSSFDNESDEEYQSWFYTEYGTPANETASAEEDSGFDVMIISNHDEINVNQTLEIKVNITLQDIMIFSLTANASLKTPDGIVELFNRNISKRESTLEYEYFIAEEGEYSYEIDFEFDSEKYVFSDNFEILNSSQKELESNYSNTTEINVSNGLNLSDTSFSGMNSSVLLFNISGSIDNNSLNGTILDSIVENNKTKINKNETGLARISKNKTIYDNKKLLEKFRKETGLNFSINIPPSYEYEYGPIMINSTAKLFNDTIPLAGNLSFVIYPVENPSNPTRCDLDINGTRQFYCELPSSFIEISKYIMKGYILIDENEYYIDQYFDLELKEEKDIELEVDFRPFVESGEFQKIVIDASDEDGIISGAQVAVKVTDSDGEIFNLEAKEKSGKYVTEFKGLIEGVYELDVLFAKGSRYKSEHYQYRVLPSDVSLDISVEEEFKHTYGTLNITGEMTLTKNDKFINRDVILTILSETGRKATCGVYCEGYCEFSCEIQNYIEFGNYTIQAVMFDNLIEYKSSANFTVDFELSDINLKVDYSPSYYLEQEQSFFVMPEIYDGYSVTDGIMYVEIIDPQNITYKLLPDMVGDGYVFTFIGAISGKYFANIAFSKEGFYAETEFSYIVLNETYDKVKKEKEQNWNSRKYNDLKKYLTYDNLDKFNHSNMTQQFIQLPARTDEPVRWVSIKKPLENKNFVRLFDQKLDNIKDTSLSRLVKQDYKFREKINESSIELDNETLVLFSEFEIDYLETEKIRKSEFKIDERKKEVRISSSYHYKDITAEVTLEDIGEAGPDKILLFWIQNGTKTIVRNITYHDDNGNGLVDRLEWYVPHLSEQIFEVEILVDTESFSVDELKFVDQNSLARFRVSYVNPDVDIRDIYERGDGCQLVMSNKSYEMVPDYYNGVFEFAYEFFNQGNYNYRIYCGDNFIDSKITVLPSSDLNLKRTKETQSFYYDNLHYLTESGVVPQNFIDESDVSSGYKEIDTNFVAKLSEARNISSLYYEVDRGLYSVKLMSFDEKYPFTFDYDGRKIQYKLLGLGFYDSSSRDSVMILDASSPTSVYRDGNKLAYKNVFDNSDLVFEYSPSKFKEELYLSKDIELPSPISYGFDPATTYLTVIFEMDVQNVVLVNGPSYGEIEFQTNNGSSTGIYLNPQRYHFEESPESSGELLRLIDKSGLEPYKIMTALPYFEFFSASSDIVIDPSFSIISTNRDAMSVNTQTRIDYYDAQTQYLLVGRNNGEEYFAGLQFPLNIPVGATITNAFITVVPGTNQSGNPFVSNITVEDAANSEIYDTALGNLTGRDYRVTNVEWALSVWDTASNYSTPDLSSLVQEIIDIPGWQDGNYIAFKIDAGDSVDGDFRSLHDYSSAGNNYATLTVVYLANESRPTIELINPPNGTMTSQNKFNFSFRAIDSEGLDTCQLWFDTDSTLNLNQTISSVANDTVVEFSEVTLDDGYYYWNVWCNDTMGNYRFNETDFELLVDTQLPVIELNSPIDGDNLTDFVTYFNWTVTDASPTVNCNLTYYNLNNLQETNVTSLVVSTSGMYNYSVSNLAVGNYEWNVTCVDLVNNNANSSTNSFNLSRNTTLFIDSDWDYYANYTLFQNILFTANYSLANDTPISDASCIIEFNDSNSYNMTYNTGLFELVRQFNAPYDIGYNVTCNHSLYDIQFAEKSLYIYPLVNISAHKDIKSVGVGRYNITLKFENLMNISSYVNLYDFVYRGFNVTSVSEDPINYTNVTGGFIGRVYYWQYFMDPGQKRNITYVVEPYILDFVPSKLYMVGFSSFD